MTACPYFARLFCLIIHNARNVVEIRNCDHGLHTGAKTLVICEDCREKMDMENEHAAGPLDPEIDVSRKSPDHLVDDVYEELRRLAASYLRNERAGHTLQPTALVHEAYLRLDAQKDVDWKCRSHFFAVGARMMRRVLVDHARGRGRNKRGGDWQRLFLSQAGGEELQAFIGRDYRSDDLLDLSLKLELLGEVDPRAAEVVEFRFFGGLTIAEIADLLGVSSRTVDSDWAYARAWLRRALTQSETP